MEFNDRDYFISRLLSSYILLDISGKKHKLYNPSKEIMYEANELVRELKNKYELLTDDEIYIMLLERNLWTEKQENELNVVIPDNLEKLKIGLFEALLQSDKQKKIRDFINATRKEQDKLYGLRHAYDYLTLDGFLSYCKNQFIIEQCSDIEDVELGISSYYKTIMSVELIRELARTTPWTAYWPTFKANGRIFESSYLTLEQQQLIQWSLIYDNAHESSEYPPDRVIEDDDMFDGWLLIQRKKRSTEQNKQHIESKLTNPKINSADEIFIKVDSFDDAKIINELNGPIDKMIKQSRLKQIQKHGIVKEGNLSDVRMDIALRKNQLESEKLRSR